VVRDQGVDTSTAVGRMLSQILGAISEFELALMSERTLDGLEAARSRGRTGGQKPKLGPRQAKLAQQMYDECDAEGKRKPTVAQIAAEFGGTRPTVYRRLSKPAAGNTPTSLLAAHVDHGACPAAPTNEAVPQLRRWRVARQSAIRGSHFPTQGFAHPRGRPSRASPRPAPIPPPRR
jgi:hypothetical protein